jgi:hypothetical protein
MVKVVRAFIFTLPEIKARIVPRGTGRQKLVQIQYVIIINGEMSAQKRGGKNDNKFDENGEISTIFGLRMVFSAAVSVPG